MSSPVADNIKQYAQSSSGSLIFAIAVLVIGWLAGYFLGRAIARTIPNLFAATIVGRICTLIGIVSALPLAYKLVTHI